MSIVYNVEDYTGAVLHSGSDFQAAVDYLTIDIEEDLEAFAYVEVDGTYSYVETQRVENAALLAVKL